MRAPALFVDAGSGPRLRAVSIRTFARARTITPSEVRSVERTRIVVPGALIRAGSRRPRTAATERWEADVVIVGEGVVVGVVDATGAMSRAPVGFDEPPLPPLPPLLPPPPPPLAAGVTGAEALEAELEPVAFVAITVKVYGVPLSNPVIVQEEVDDKHVRAPGLEVAVYVSDWPPLKAGGVQLTTADPSPGVALTAVGVPGSEPVTVRVRDFSERATSLPRKSV